MTDQTTSGSFVSGGLLSAGFIASAPAAGRGPRARRFRFECSARFRFAENHSVGGPQALGCPRPVCAGEGGDAEHQR